MKKTAIIVQIFLIAMLVHCQAFIDDQLEALTCCKDGFKVGQTYCEDGTIYVCPTSCRWEKLVECRELPEWAIDELNYEQCCYSTKTILPSE